MDLAHFLAEKLMAELEDISNRDVITNFDSAHT